MARWIALGTFYGGVLIFASALGGANGFWVAVLGAVLVLAFMTMFAFIGKAFRMWSRRLYQDMSPDEIRARLYGRRR